METPLVPGQGVKISLAPLSKVRISNGCIIDKNSILTFVYVNSSGYRSASNAPMQPVQASFLFARDS